MVNTLTQSGRTKTYALDPAGRVLTIADTAGLTLTDHYTEPGDNPAWIGASDGTWTRYTDTSAGDLGLSVYSTGAVQLQLANLHGDIVTTAGPTDTTVPNYTETTDYGLSRDTTTPATRYGRLGGQQRDTGDALAQLTLMGARLYNPTTGRFLSTDPQPGGSANDYDYCTADPINCTDIDGKWPHPHWLSVRHFIATHKVDIALTALSFAPGIGSAIWAYRAYRVVRIARAAYKAGRVGESIRASRATSWLAGRMWVGRGAYRDTAKNGARWLRSRHHKFSWRSARKKSKFGDSSNLDYSQRGHHDYRSFTSTTGDGCSVSTRK